MSDFYICPDCAYSIVPCAKHGIPRPDSVPPYEPVPVVPMVPPLPAVPPMPPMFMGWQCPNCRTVHSPYVTSCRCSSTYTVTTISTSNEITIDGEVTASQLTEALDDLRARWFKASQS